MPARFAGFGVSVGQITKPLVPEGPVRDFYDSLHLLHIEAGQPSMREIQRGTRSATRPNGINPTTIHDAFSAPRLARWEVVEAIIRRLGGDVATFADLWQAARDADVQAKVNTAPYTETTAVAPATPTPGAAVPVPVPRQLPLDVFAFTGRDTALSEMDRLVDTTRDQPSAVVISALAGTAGVGKTALAVHWAHRVADRFPDGHLYVDLRGYGPDEPVTPHRALAGFLRTLGVAGQDIPYELAERAARYRSLMAGRQMLVVLDNVRSVDQVRPLLPGSPTCVALVTSRDSLAGLVARDGARRIELDLLTPGEAVDLLGRLIGARAEAEPKVVAQLAERCARLPLALRLAAELAAAHPMATLEELVADLDNQQRRLELLDAGAGADQHTGIQSVFSWSYRELAPQTAGLFRLLGVNPGADIDPHAAAALANQDLAEVRAGLDTLVRAHLVQHGPRGRYVMHDLLRAYASRLARQDRQGDAVSAALNRLFDYYLITSARAMDLVFPAERHQRPTDLGTTAVTPRFTTATQARAWLDEERDTLVVCVTHAANNGWPVHAAKIAAVLYRYLQNGAHHREAVAVHTAALQACAQVGDRAGEGTALTNLGAVYWRLDKYEHAAAIHHQALDACVETGDRAGEARVLVNLGAIYWQQGWYADSADSCERALQAFRDTGNRSGEARALDNIGAVRHRQGRYDEAAEFHNRALAIYRELGDRAGEARALDNLGAVRQRQGRYDEAASCHQQALEILRDAGDRAGEAQALENVGNLLREQGRYTEAFAWYEEVLETASRIGSRSREASTLNAMGEAFRATGQPERAEINHELARQKAIDTDNWYERARALDGLASARRAGGDREAAGQRWREALVIYDQIGVPEADTVRAQLHTLDADVHEISASFE